MAIELLNTELDAVNLCLRSIGREPVATLDTADLDAATAKDSIDQISLDIQSRNGGWWFNREKGWGLEPNHLTGHVFLPNNALGLIEARCSFYDQGNRLAIRGNRLYDTDGHTYDLRGIVGQDGKIHVSMVLALEYEDLPPQARQVIAWTARRLFSNDTVGDTQQDARDKYREDQAMAQLERAETRAMRYNYLRDNKGLSQRVSNMLGGYGRRSYY